MNIVNKLICTKFGIVPNLVHNQIWYCTKFGKILVKSIKIYCLKLFLKSS